jgi:cobalt transporter subunit CbtB
MAPSQIAQTQIVQTQVAQTQVAPLPGAAATSQVGRLSQSLMAMVLGLFVVGMVGFSHIDVLHNAAHDVRHSNAFPCH